MVTLAAAGAGLLLPTWYYRQRAQRRRGEIEEAVGEAVETLRDAVRIGLGVEEALRALAVTGPQALRPVFSGVERDLRLAGFEEALDRARERLAEPLFDTLAVALLTAYRIGGRNLAAVLDGLSASVRGSVQVRREVRANQAQNVLSARVIAALPLLLDPGHPRLQPELPVRLLAARGAGGARLLPAEHHRRLHGDAEAGGAAGPGAGAEMTAALALSCALGAGLWLMLMGQPVGRPRPELGARLRRLSVQERMAEEERAGAPGAPMFRWALLERLLRPLLEDAGGAASGLLQAPRPRGRGPRLTA